MFGSEAVAIHVDTRLAALAAVTDVVGERRYPLEFDPGIPGFGDGPALLSYPDAPGQYGSPIGAEIDSEQLTWVTRFIVPGSSTEAIRDAAWAVLADLNGDGSRGDVEIDGVFYLVTMRAQFEFAPTTLLDQNGELYRTLGTIWAVQVVPGG